MSSELTLGPRSATTKRQLVQALLIIGAAAIILALPMLVYGPYPQAHDAYEHLTFNRYFSQQFWAGDWFPRWLIGVNRGLGSPTFFVYPPFQAYVYAILRPPTTALHLNTFVTEEFLVLVASGICAFLWLGTISERRIAIAGAVLYMLAPYHLSSDFYFRNALPECWALVWIPLLLYFSSRIMGQKRGAVISFAAAYALLLLSHLISALIFSSVPVAAALLLSKKGQRLHSALAIAAGIFLGTGLSCFYLIPALYNAKNFPPERLIPQPSQTLSLFLAGAQSILGDNHFYRAVAFIAADAIIVCFACGIAVFAIGRPESKRRASFWLAISVIPAFMICSVSLPIWRSWPALLAAVQYPFRLNIVLCVAEVAIVTIFLSESMGVTRLAAVIRFVLLLLVIVPWACSYLLVWKYYLQQPDPQAELASDEGIPFLEDGWFSSWTVPGLDGESAVQASTGPRVRFTSGVGTANVWAWMPRHIEFQTNSSTGGQVMINQFYYPSWQASLVPSAQRLVTKPAMPEGLVEVRVPAGQEQVSLDIGVEPAERVGLWISGLSVMLSLILIWAGKKDDGPRLGLSFLSKAKPPAPRTNA